MFFVVVVVVVEVESFQSIRVFLFSFIHILRLTCNSASPINPPARSRAPAPSIARAVVTRNAASILGDRKKETFFCSSIVRVRWRSIEKWSLEKIAVSFFVNKHYRKRTPSLSSLSHAISLSLVPSPSLVPSLKVSRNYLPVPLFFYFSSSEAAAAASSLTLDRAAPAAASTLLLRSFPGSAAVTSAPKDWTSTRRAVMPSMPRDLERSICRIC